MDSLVAMLMIWIASNTAYDVGSIQPPEVRLLSPQEMTEEYYSGTDAPMPTSKVFTGIFALYNYEDAENGIVFLLDPRQNDALSPESDVTEEVLNDLSKPLHHEWLSNPVFQEQLLHELIHHVQYQTGAVDQFPCPAYAEKEAYLLGGR